MYLMKKTKKLGSLSRHCRDLLFLVRRKHETHVFMQIFKNRSANQFDAKGLGLSNPV